MKFSLGKPLDPKSYYSEANIITLIRLVGSLTFFLLAIVKQDPLYNYIGLGIHWVLDVGDGWYARKFKQETILGAEIDIIADRFEIFFFFAIFLHFRPHLYLPSALYLLDFGFIDYYLSNQFLKYDIISPNYFYKVDRVVYLLNYSPVGKCVNSSVIILSLIFFPQFSVLVSVLACGLIAVKSYSVFRLYRLGKRLEEKQLAPE